MKSALFRLLATATCLALLSGCHDDNPAKSSGAIINNSPGSFELIHADASDVTATNNYSWINTEARAAVSHMTERIDGSAVIRIKDDGDTEVYVSNLMETGTEESAIGIPGTWTITVTFDKFDGTAHFKVVSN